MLHLSPKSVHVNQYEGKALNEKPGDCQKNSSAVCCPNDDGTAMQFDLYQNDTQYVVYNVEVGDDVRQFELSIQAALADPGSGMTLMKEILSIQPWQSYAAPDGDHELSNTTASATSTNLSGTVTMGNIGVESYNIFDVILDSYALTQTSLGDEGECLLIRMKRYIKQMLLFLCPMSLVL